MPYVSVGISDGLGNRFFQVAALLGYAEKHGHTPVFVRQWIGPTNHGGPRAITDFFPSVRVVDLSGSWTQISQSHDDSFKFIDLPFIAGNVKLVGCFQSEKYFPRVFPHVGLIEDARVPTGVDDGCAFLHVRRGDYLLPVCAHHNVDLTLFRRYALAAFEPSVKIVVCSDDMAWCRRSLPALYGDLIADDRWIFLDDDATNDVTLAVMARCGAGGICSNSSFSWMGAFFGPRRGGLVFMPGTWGYAPLPSPHDLFPPWATLLPV
jgi:hypothetical protein